MEFDFVREIRFIEQRSGNPDSPRVTDLDDSRFRGHGNYSVATRPARRKSGDVPAGGTERSSVGVVGLAILLNSAM